MQTFKRALCFLLVNILVAGLLQFALAQPSVIKILLKEARDGDYDTLFVGQSHGESGLDPFVYSEAMGCAAFNLNRRLLPLDDIYYLVQEANRDGRYKTVVLDVDPVYWNGVFTGSCGMDGNLLPYLSGTRKLGYFVGELAGQHWNIALFDYMLNESIYRSAAGNVKTKLNRAYLAGSEEAIPVLYENLGVSPNYRYVGRGFRYGQRRSSASWPSWNFDPATVSEGKIESFSKLVRYCRAHGIELICVQSALPPHRLRQENMGEVHDYFAGLFASFDVPFLDMNYARNLPRTDEDYADLDGHMLGELADRHTARLCEILRAEDRADCFYTSYDEVLEALVS